MVLDIENRWFITYKLKTTTCYPLIHIGLFVMLCFDGDDVESVLRLLEDARDELNSSQTNVDQICLEMDKLCGVDVGAVDDVAQSIADELKHKMKLDILLDTGLKRLYEAQYLLEEQNYREISRLLSFHQLCQKELYKWQDQKSKAQLELFELQKLASQVQRKQLELIKRL